MKNWEPVGCPGPPGTGLGPSRREQGLGRFAAGGAASGVELVPRTGSPGATGLPGYRFSGFTAPWDHEAEMTRVGGRIRAPSLENR